MSHMQFVQENLLREHTDGGGLVAHAQRLNFSGVGPRDGEDTESEAVEVEEDERYGCCGACVAVLRETACDDGHAGCTAG